MSGVSGKPARINSCDRTAVANGSLSTSTPLQSKMTTGSSDASAGKFGHLTHCPDESAGEDRDGTPARNWFRAPSRQLCTPSDWIVGIIYPQDATGRDG